MTRSHEADYGRYSLVIEWEPEGAVFVVTVPELPGCMTHGETYEEAVARAQDAIESWIDVAREDQDIIPPPRYHDLGEVEAAAPEPVGATAP